MPTPSDIFSTSLKLWIGKTSTSYTDAGVTVATDGQSVYQINDLSASALNATQTTSGSRPTLDTDIISGAYRGLVFDGTADHLSLGNVLNTTLAGTDKQWSFWWVGRLRNMIGGQTLLGKYSTGDNQRQLLIRCLDGRMVLSYYTALTSNAVRQISTGRTFPVNDLVAFVLEYDGSIDTNDGADRCRMWVNAERMPTYLSATAGSLSDIQTGTAPLALGAFISGGTPGGFAAIDGAEWGIASGLLTASNIEELHQYFESAYGISQKVERKEYFLDSARVSAVGGAAALVTVPAATKYGSNPIMGNAAWTWDRDIHWPDAHYRTDWGDSDPNWRMWYSGIDTGGGGGICYATSEDGGYTWDKPIIGVHTYGGNTNNNLVLPNVFHPSIVFDPDAPSSRRYVMLAEKDNVGTNGSHIYTSANGKTSWTYQTSLPTGTDGGDTYREAKWLVKRSDGRWAVFSTGGHFATPEARKIFMQVSDGTDPTATWTDTGTLVINSTAITAQKYWIGGQQLSDDLWVCAVGDYDGTNTVETIHADLYISRNEGTTWTLVKDGWIPLGAGGSWEDGFNMAGHKINRVGNTWYYHYAATAENHIHALPREARVGLATVPYGRLGGYSGTSSSDTVTTRAFIAPNRVLVTADGSGGSVTVDVIDGVSGSAIGGYGATITSDVTEQQIILPEGDYVQLKFTLNNGTVYAYETVQQATRRRRTGLSGGMQTLSGL